MKVIPPARLPVLLAAGACLLLIAQAGVAQGTAKLTGRILDSTGTPIAGAALRVPSLERGAVTDAAGRYTIDSLPTGKLTVVGEAPGYFGRRVDVTLPLNGTVEQSFALSPNARVLTGVEVRAKMHEQLPPKLAEFASRRSKVLGKFLGPADVARYNGQPLTEALKPILTGSRMIRNNGVLMLISSRQLNAPSSLRTTENTKPCGVQIWQDGMLMSDPQASADVIIGGGAGGQGVVQNTVGIDRSFDFTGLVSDDYMAVEYYPDLASTPPGFRTGTATCGVLVLWTRVPMPKDGDSQVKQ